MSKPKKLLLGVLTVWPLAYMVLFMSFVLTMIMTAHPGRGQRSGPPGWMPALFIAHLGTMLLILGLTVFYAAHAYRSRRVPENRRVLWVMLNVIGSFVAQIIYWYVFIWREPETLLTKPSPESS